MGAAVKLSEHDVTAKLDELPTLPSIVYELSKVINDPMSSTGDVEKLMSNDQSLTTKVLKLVNSAYYAIPGGVSSLSRAIAYIGFDTVNQLVLSASILSALETKEPTDFKLAEFWKHCIGVALGAETIARFVRHPSPSDVFTCGLVHDMGKVALLIIAPDMFLEVVKNGEEKGLSYLESEKELDYPRHCLVGYTLAEKWNLPSEIQSCIKHHHQPDSQLRGGLTPQVNQLVDMVLLSNILTHALKFGDSGHKKVIGAPKDVMKRLGMNPEADVKPLLLKIRAAHEQAADFLRVLGG